MFKPNPEAIAASYLIIHGDVSEIKGFLQKNSIKVLIEDPFGTYYTHVPLDKDSSTKEIEDMLKLKRIYKCWPGVSFVS